MLLGAASWLGACVVFYFAIAAVLASPDSGRLFRGALESSRGLLFAAGGLGLLVSLVLLVVGAKAFQAGIWRDDNDARFAGRITAATIPLVGVWALATLALGLIG